MRVSDFILDSVRGFYLPGFRNVLSAEVFTVGDFQRYSASRENPVCLADFNILPGSYTVGKNEHVGCVDVQACINQIAHVAWAQLLEEGIVNFGSSSDFLSRGLEGIFGIGSAPNFKNKKRIPTNQKFGGIIQLVKFKEFGDGMLMEANYDFNQRACIGTSKFYIERST